MSNQKLSTSDGDKDYSRRNDLHYRSLPYCNQINTAVESLYQEFLPCWKALYCKKQDPAYNYRSTLLKHIEIIILDLYVCWLSDPERFVGYSRNAKEFKKDGSYYDGFNKKPFLSENAFLGVIDTLGELDYIDNHIATQGREGRSSRMRATQKLLDLFKTHEVLPPMIGRSKDEQVILLNSKKDSAGEKEKIWYKDRQHPKAKLSKKRKNLQRINDYLARQFIGLDVSKEQLDRINKKVRGERRPKEQAVDFTRKRLYRIFSEGSFDTGGRFYGGWWQGIPSEFRRHIMIQNVRTDECDFSTLHPRIIYAEETKKALPDNFDAYDLRNEGWDYSSWNNDEKREFRGYCKKAFQQLLNAKPSKAPLETKLRQLIPPDIIGIDIEDGDDWYHDKAKRLRLNKAFENRYSRPYTDLLKAMIKKHHQIEHRFFKADWKRLQKVDSDMAEKVMLEMVDEDVVALPIHDSFVVRQGFRNNLLRSMNKVFREMIGVDGKIDTDLGAYSDSPERGLINAADLLPEIKALQHKRFNPYRYHLSEWMKVHGLNGIN